MSLSDDNIKFLQNWIFGNYMSDYEKIPKFSSEQLNNFKLFTPKKPIILYRGVYIDVDDFFKNEKKFYSGLPNKYYERNRLTSWTTSLEIAENFANNSIINYVIQGKFSPNDILIDTTLLKSKQLIKATMGHETHLEQKEVIVKPGKYEIEYLKRPLIENKEETFYLKKIVDINAKVYGKTKQSHSNE